MWLAKLAAVAASLATATAAGLDDCVRIVTGGDGSWDDGPLEVVVNGQVVSGNNTYYDFNSTVLDQCYTSITSVVVGNPGCNAWDGTIEGSTDGGANWTAMYCPSCTGGIWSTGKIVVSACYPGGNPDNDGTNWHGGTQCLGHSCELFFQGCPTHTHTHTLLPPCK